MAITTEQEAIQHLWMLQDGESVSISFAIDSFVNVISSIPGFVFGMESQFLYLRLHIHLGHQSFDLLLLFSLVHAQLI